MPRHPHSDTRPRWGLYLRACLERRLTTLLVFRVKGEDASIWGPHRDRVMTERGRGGPCRGVGVTRGCLAHDVLERDLVPPFALQVIDAIDRDEGPRDIACDRVEDLKLPSKTLGTRRLFHIEDADDLVAGAERQDHGFAGTRVTPAETVVVNRPEQDDALAPGGDPSGDTLVDPLLVSDGHGYPDRRTDAKTFPFDEHDRRPARTHPRSDVLGRSCQKCRRIACLLETREEVLEERDAIVVLRVLVFRVRHRPAVANAHREELRGGACRGELDSVEGNAVAERAE